MSRRVRLALQAEFVSPAGCRGSVARRAGDV
jgi:hypothetical protein